MTDTYKKYTQWLKLNCDSPSTIKTYSKYLKTFFNINKEFNQENVDEYFIAMINRKSSPNHFNLTKNAFINYLKFSKQEIVLPKYKKTDKRVNKYLTHEEIRILLTQLDWLFERNYRKVELIVKIFFLTGLRPAEFIRLKRKDINLDKGYIELFNTKGNRDRLIPLTKNLKEEMRTFFEMNQEGDNAFNLGRDGLKWVFDTINHRDILNLLNQRVTPTLLRHSCAVNMVRSGVDLFSIKNILGHSDIKITEIYAEPDFRHTKEMFTKLVKDLS